MSRRQLDQQHEDTYLSELWLLHLLLAAPPLLFSDLKNLKKLGNIPPQILRES